MCSSDLSQYESHVFPLSVIGSGGWDLPNWVQGYEAHWRAAALAAREAGNTDAVAVAEQHTENAHRFGEHLRGIVEQYQVAYIELDRDLELDRVCDIFTQINSKGIRLDVFDLFNALLKPKGLQLKHMWRKAAPGLDFVDTEKMNVYILQLMSILRQSYCSPKYLYYLIPGQAKSVRERDGSLRKEILIADTGQFEALWAKAVSALTRAVELLRHPHEFGVISSQYLPYVSILPVFAAIQAEARELPPEQQLDAQRKIRHWYWASVFTNRYSGSVESTSARDFLDIKAWFDDSSVKPALLAEFESRFLTLDLRREVKRGTSVYNGIFNLFVLNGARDWMTGNVPQYGDLDDHHIVPKDWGKANPDVRSLVDSILNRTPLTADTNRNVIRNRLPNAYLPELIASNSEPAVRAILHSHFISSTAFDILLRNPFTPSDLEAFLGERQRTIQAGIEDLLIKGRLDLTPPLRDLDERIERIELRLRSFVSEALQGDVSMLPSHVRQRVGERLSAIVKKNPATNPEYLSSLAGTLEHCDLRELQDIITGKGLWSLFEQRFVNKETLAGKFDRLAELRNRLRHSRTVDNISRKEGEAAILWFEQVLEGVGRSTDRRF